MKTESQILELLRTQFQNELLKINSFPSTENILGAYDRAVVKTIVKSHDESNKINKGAITSQSA